MIISSASVDLFRLGVSSLAMAIISSIVVRSLDTVDERLAVRLSVRKNDNFRKPWHRKFIFTGYRSSSYIKVVRLRSRSQDQKSLKIPIPAM